jgi:hypothetical protein
MAAKTTLPPKLKPDSGANAIGERDGSFSASGGAHPSSLARFDKLTAGEKAIRREYLQPSQ